MTRLWRRKICQEKLHHDEMLADLMAQMNDTANKANYVLLNNLRNCIKTYYEKDDLDWQARRLAADDITDEENI